MKKEKKGTIIISISSGIIGRNILSIPNGFLTHALRVFKKIILVVPESTQDFFEKEYASDAVIIETIEDQNFVYETNNIIKKLFSFFYTFLLFSENAKVLAWEGVYFKSRPKNTWYGRISYPVKWIIGNTFGKFSWFRTSLVPFLDTIIHKKTFYKDIFDKYQPHVVFAPNVDKWQDICLIREARKYGVPSVGMPGSWDHLPKRFRPLHPDQFLVNTYTQKAEALTYQSYKESQVTVVGVPYYDAFTLTQHLLSREEFCREIGLDPEKKIIFFSSESVYTPDDGDIADMLYSWSSNNEFDSPTQLFVRPYPGVEIEHEKFDFLEDKKGVYLDWIENKMKRVSNDPWYPSFKEIIHFVNILHHCDVIINTYSSIAIEAAFFGKQAIWVNFDGYKNRPEDMSVRRFARKIHLQNILETGGVCVVENQAALHEAVNARLSEDFYDARLEILRHKMCGPMDGRTGERMATFLFDCLERSNTIG